MRAVQYILDLLWWNSFSNYLCRTIFFVCTAWVGFMLLHPVVFAPQKSINNFEKIVKKLLGKLPLFVSRLPIFTSATLYMYVFLREEQQGKRGRGALFVSLRSEHVEREASKLRESLRLFSQTLCRL